MSATRSAYEVFDRVGGAHKRGSMATTDWHDWGASRHGERIEVFDFTRQLWVKPDRKTRRRLEAMSHDQVRAMLRNMPFGYRLAPEFEDEPARDAVLDAAIARGRLDLGGRSYPLGTSRGGYITVYSASFGTVNYTRGALLDVIQRGHF